MPPVPADVSDMVGRMLQRRREDRPEDLREVLAVLRRYTGASVRTFGGARRALEDSVHRVDAADEPDEASADTQRAPRLLRDADQDPSTPVPATSTPDAVSSSVPSARPSSRKPVEVHVTTARRFSPQDLTLADGATLNAPPARASHRTALIAGLGAGAGVVATVVTLMVLHLSPAAPSTGARANASAPRPALSPAVVASPVPPADPAQPSTPAAPAQSASVEATDPPAPGPSAKHPAVAGGARPPSGAHTSAPPPAPAPTAEPHEQPAKRTGGLVDEPPF